MILSMTGFGRAEVSDGSITAFSEVRSMNNRFLDISVRLPKNLLSHENEVRDIIKQKITRGKIFATISIEYNNGEETPLKINQSAVKVYYRLLQDIKKTLKLKEKITLNNILTFPDILEPKIAENALDEEWRLSEQSLQKAIDEMLTMRKNEGIEISKDLIQRINFLSKIVNETETLSKNQIPEQRSRLRDRVSQILGDSFNIDQNRIELEIALLADKLDVTEECVRLRSHLKFFLETISDNEPAGRKLTFLIQEMNREANTIGAKSSDAEIARRVIAIKEELEKIREQLQNIE